MDSSGTKVPVVSGHDRQVPEELKPLYKNYVLQRLASPDPSPPHLQPQEGVH